MENRKTDMKIVHVSLDLFARKGYTESSVREIADAVGIKEPSIYNHFKSKAAILEHILDKFATAMIQTVPDEKLNNLTKNAGVDDVIDCFDLSFPKDEERYYLQTLQVLFQEQCRNEDIRRYMADNKFDGIESCAAAVLGRLVEVGALGQSLDIGFWSRAHANISYMVSGGLALGQAYDQEQMLRLMYDKIFMLYGDKS